MYKYKKGDFHIHSTYSDGSLTPKELIEKAKKRKVDIISLTDHNSIKGIHEAIIEGEKRNIKVIPGVEVSSRFNNVRVHILGYFKDGCFNENFIAALDCIKNHNIKCFNKIMHNKLNISFRREHVCVEIVIALLKKFNATVILAHPVLLPRKYFEDIVSIGFDGIEAKYYKNTKEDTDFFVNYAISNNMIYTAGSDFHNEIELYRSHGNLGEVFLNESEIDRFLKFLNT